MQAPSFPRDSVFVEISPATSMQAFINFTQATKDVIRGKGYRHTNGNDLFVDDSCPDISAVVVHSNGILQWDSIIAVHASKCQRDKRFAHQKLLSYFPCISEKKNVRQG